MLSEVGAGHGRLDIVVNNAAARFETPLLDMSFEEWRSLLAVNLDGVFLCTKAALPHLVAAGGGSIVNLGGRRLTPLCQNEPTSWPARLVSPRSRRQSRSNSRAATSRPTASCRVQSTPCTDFREHPNARHHDGYRRSDAGAASGKSLQWFGRFLDPMGAISPGRRST
jgi:short chain dehydrogenase